MDLDELELLAAAGGVVHDLCDDDQAAIAGVGGTLQEQWASDNGKESQQEADQGRAVFFHLILSCRPVGVSIRPWFSQSAEPVGEPDEMKTIS